MLTVTTLSYSDDLISNYQSLSELPGFVLLESSDKTIGRYDIVTAFPYDRFVVSSSSSNLSEAYHQLQKKLKSTTSTLELPFQGGAIGYFSYDFGAELAGIKSNPHPVIADMPLIDMYFYDWAIIVDHLRCLVFLVAQNRNLETKEILREIQERWEDKFAGSNVFSMLQPFSPVVTQAEYEQAFNCIHADLRAGRAYQVNYTQPFVAEFMGDPWEMYKRVRQKNPVPYAAFLRFDHSDVLSFSPERFLLMEERLLLTSPIKGSIKRSSDRSEDDAFKKDLIISPKNRAENIMIVDLLRNDLGKIAVAGSVRVHALCELQSYACVHHLVSEIEALRRENISAVQAFGACFPGGSITGAPKREAMYIINEQETYSRGIYCGSIGYFSNHGRFDSNIAIRTVTARNNHLYLAAGGGIVIDSTWKEEYSECYTKIAAIVNQLK